MDIMDSKLSWITDLTELFTQQDGIHAWRTVQSDSWVVDWIQFAKVVQPIKCVDSMSKITEHNWLIRFTVILVKVISPVE